MTQTVFTVITKVEPKRLDDLRSVLAEIGADAASNAVLPFGTFDALHFASLVLAQGGKLPPTLIFEHNVDGSLDDWLRTLVAQSTPGLHAIYRHCVGYPGEGDSEKLRAYLARHVVRPGAYHIGATGRSLARIRQEAKLREAIEAHVESQMASGTQPKDGRGWRSSIQEFVKGNPALAWATTKPENTAPHHQTKAERRGHLGRLAGLALAVVVLLPVLAPILFVWAVLLRWKESHDAVQRVPADPSQIEALTDTEDFDFIAQNHLASVIEIKAGRLRALTLPAVLYVLNLVARVNGTKGKLAGIPSIHFAHWSTINGGSHLMFLSNFDGSWESYLGDFIDKGAKGLTAVWSNTVEFPETRFLTGKGAADGPKFRMWARAHQCPTPVWYSAYPRYSMAIIDNNSAIREGLWSSTRDDKKVKAWLRRL